MIENKRSDEKAKIKVAIFFGGCSTEYSVSLQSAAAVIEHIDRKRFIPVMVGISSQGDWFLYEGDLTNILNNNWCNPSNCTPITISLNRREHYLLTLEGPQRKIYFDMAFPVLHGKNGEDGSIQGLFELANIPIVGCRTLSSALSMDKHRAHILVSAEGILSPRSIVINKNTPLDSIHPKAKNLEYPLFVKPIRSGSSHGISKVSDSSQLDFAIKLALEHDDMVILEECISGFEVGCAVMGYDSLLIGEIDEIELSDGFFDFTEKYTLKSSFIHVPSRINSEIAYKIKETAKIIYKALDCKGFARVDMFLNAKKEIYFNEVNTIPGFTAHSRFPNMMKSVGISFTQIISKAIDFAVEEQEGWTQDENE